jgi:hypothetical protein
MAADLYIKHSELVESLSHGRGLELLWQGVGCLANAWGPKEKERERDKKEANAVSGKCLSRKKRKTFMTPVTSQAREVSLDQARSREEKWQGSTI